MKWQSCVGHVSPERDFISVSSVPSPPPYAYLGLLCIGKVQNVLPYPSSLITVSANKHGLASCSPAPSYKQTKPHSELPPAPLQWESKEEGPLLNSTHTLSSYFLHCPSLWRKGRQQQTHNLQHANPLLLSSNINFVLSTWEVHAFLFSSLWWLETSESQVWLKCPFFPSTVSFLDHWTSKQDMGLLPFLEVDTDSYGEGTWRCHLGYEGGHV